MTRRIQSIIIALTTIAVSANAQNISFEVQANEARINLSGATEMTALQFCLKLPEGVGVDKSKATLGSATDGHTLCIETLNNGDLLFILYSINLRTFADGELLRAPISGVQEGNASISAIRYAGEDAVSHEAEEIVTKSPHLTSPKKDGLIYNVSGQRLNKTQKGINIINGKKIMK